MNQKVLLLLVTLLGLTFTQTSYEVLGLEGNAKND